MDQKDLLNENGYGNIVIFCGVPFHDQLVVHCVFKVIVLIFVLSTEDSHEEIFITGSFGSGLYHYIINKSWHHHKGTGGTGMCFLQF